MAICHAIMTEGLLQLEISMYPFRCELQILTVALQNSGFIKAGICFPKSCSTDDLLQIVNACKYAVNVFIELL